MNNSKIIPIFIFTILFSFTQSYSQGELLNKNQSGGTFLYEIFKIDGTRAHSISYAYTHKRVFETGISAFRSGPIRSRSEGVGLYFAGFLNSETWLHLKASAGIAFAGDEIGTAINSTLFLENSKSQSKVVPSLTLSLVDGGLAYSGGLQFRLGEKLGFVLGLQAIKFKDEDTVISVTLGLSLAQKVENSQVIE